MEDEGTFQDVAFVPVYLITISIFPVARGMQPGVIRPYLILKVL